MLVNKAEWMFYSAFFLSIKQSLSKFRCVFLLSTLSDHAAIETALIIDNEAIQSGEEAHELIILHFHIAH